MNTERWYAAKLRFIILLETTGSEDASDSLFLLRADDFETAFACALELGRRTETEYLGGTSERVRWRFKELLALHTIDDLELDGAEVYSAFTPLDEDERYPFDYVFQPEASQPHSNELERLRR